MAVVDDLEALAGFGRGEEGGITRLAWTRELAAALGWFEERLGRSGLAVERDAAGNVFGVRDGGRTGRRLLVGSHLDTVPAGGRFDGALGVVGGLAALDLLRERGYEARRPLAVASFMDEEGSRFGVSMFGSRAFVGDELSHVRARRDAAGVTLDEAMAGAGFDSTRLPEARGVDGVAAYVELHVEQGPVLEQEGADVGIATGVVGLLHARVELRGEANHAGTTPMEHRRDALVAAARVVLALREELGCDGARVTVGEIGVAPGAFNVVPGVCWFSVDYRTLDPDSFRRADHVLRTFVDAVAADGGLSATVDVLDRDPPVTFDERIVAVLERAAAAEGARSLRMPSGAGHDAMLIARRVPAGMLFVPSRGGVSHSPAEHTDPEHCELGVRVLARALQLLDEHEIDSWEETG